MKTILKGTDLIVVSAEFRLYYKMGGLKQAVEDFNKLNPKDVKIDVSDYYECHLMKYTVFMKHNL